MRVDIIGVKPIKLQPPLSDDTVISIRDEWGEWRSVEWDEEKQKYVIAEETEVIQSIEVPDDATREEIEVAVHAASGGA